VASTSRLSARRMDALVKNLLAAYKTSIDSLTG
jgi:hypothetical protein